LRLGYELVEQIHGKAFRLVPRDRQNETPDA